LNKDKKDRKGRAIVVAHTPPPSKRHQALWPLEALRRLMCNSGQRRRSPDRMLHQTLSKGWCHARSGLLLGLIVRARGRLVEARSRFAAAENRSASPAQRPGGNHPGHPRPVAPLPQREGLLAFRLLSSALLLPYPLFAEPTQGRRIRALEPELRLLQRAFAQELACPSAVFFALWTRPSSLPS
jgi:hypothetical protein